MVLIVGAGAAGLACAARLEEVGVDWLLLEAAKGPGGRIATETTPEGFVLDHGFQVILDSYPTAGNLLDFSSLRPRYFESGALLAGPGGLSPLKNPLFHPGEIPALLADDSFSLGQKLALAHYTAKMMASPLQYGASGEKETGISAMEELRRHGLDGFMMERFLRPFFGGVFLDNDLGTDSSVLRRVLRRFSLGRAFVPAGGMMEIPRQLAGRLPAERQRYSRAVSSIIRKGERVSEVILANGERVSCDTLVLATDEETSLALLEMPSGRSWSTTSTFYFTGEDSLYKGALLVLPEGKGRLVRHFTDITNTAPEYAPTGRRLLSATVLEPPPGNLEHDVRKEICEIFPGFSSWRFLKEIRVTKALPVQKPGSLALRPVRRPGPNLWLAGDQVACADIDSSLASGLLAADEVISCL